MFTERIREIRVNSRYKFNATEVKKKKSTVIALENEHEIMRIIIIIVRCPKFFTVEPENRSYDEPNHRYLPRPFRSEWKKKKNLISKYANEPVQISLHVIILQMCIIMCGARDDPDGYNIMRENGYDDAF